MKVRIGDSTLIDISEVIYVEVEESSILVRFKNNWETREFFNNELESFCVFNNLIDHLRIVDLRIQSKSDRETLDQRKERAFEMFWNLYQKKVDVNRAKKAFMNLTLEDMGKAVNTAKAYVESTPDKRYRKNPTTWLHQKGWDNELHLDKEGKKKVNRYVKPDYITDER